MWCPRCQTELRTEERAEGPFYACDACRGSATLLPTAQRALAESPGGGVPHPPGAGRLSCPACSLAMRPVRLQAVGGSRTVDLCPNCHLAWFDAGELEALSMRRDPNQRPGSMEAREAAAQLALAKHKDSPIGSVELGSHGWLAGRFGLPVLLDAPDDERRPWATWIIAGAIALLAIAQSLWDPGQLEPGGGRTLWSQVMEPTKTPWPQVLGFLPADPFRHDGLTFLTGFLLHGGPVHAFVNIYFLLLVGSVLEVVLGWWRFLRVLLLSSVVGSLADIFARWGSDVPLVGASGGIAGLFALCAFAVPTLRLGFTFGAYWMATRAGFGQLRLGVRWVFGVWLVGEAIAMSGLFDRDMLGEARPSRIAHHVHVAGALTGIGLFLLSRRLRGASAPPAHAAPLDIHLILRSTQARSDAGRSRPMPRAFLLLCALLLGAAQAHAEGLPEAPEPAAPESVLVGIAGWERLHERKDAWRERYPIRATLGAEHWVHVDRESGKASYGYPGAEGTYLWWVTVDLEAPLHTGSFGAHLQVQWRERTKFAEYYDSRLWLQEGWLFADALGGRFRAGAIPTAFGLEADDTWWGTLPFYDGLLGDTDWGLDYARVFVSGSCFALAGRAQLFLAENRVGGALAGADAESDDDHDEGPILMLRAEPSWDWGATALAVGLSGQWGLLRASNGAQDESLAGLAADATLTRGGFKLFGAAYWIDGIRHPQNYLTGGASSRLLDVVLGASWQIGAFTPHVAWSAGWLGDPGGEQQSLIVGVDVALVRNVDLYLEYVLWTVQPDGAAEQTAEDGFQLVLGWEL